MLIILEEKKRRRKKEKGINGAGEGFSERKR